MFNWLKKKDTPSPAEALRIDLHSHLLAGIDDGVKTIEQAEEIVRHFQQLGYSKLITTPHVISDSYKNTPEIIREKLQELQMHLRKVNVDVEIQAAAEYYLDDYLFKLIEQDKEVLTFGKKYLLFETNFLTEPLNLKEFVFMATVKGYKLILAHPERYQYMYHNIEKARDLMDRGVLLQMNINSIAGYYGAEVQSTAKKLIDRGWVHFLGSDCHHIQHAKLIGDAQSMKYFQKALSLPILNNTL
ncbi:MAG: CpsB/CapC family capsule biosynthesis tyrosine phosphatase [Chryseolinea sp.]